MDLHKKNLDVSTKLFNDELSLRILVDNTLEPNYNLVDNLKGLTKDEKSFMTIFNRKTHNYLIKHKTKIDETRNKNSWERMKKITNVYELVHTTHSNKNMSIAKYSPLSRSFFKMWEMLLTHKILDIGKEPIKTAHLAEGPGGFIEAVNNYRKNINDQRYGITLKSDNKDIPGWVNSLEFLKKNKNVNISYGYDGTGNLYNLDNIMEFKMMVGEAELVTADGGFDFSTDFNSQELMSQRLLFCEITTILSVQKKGGNFVCKFFDMFENSTIQLLWIIGQLYDELIITKPVTSRPANSEKYVIGKGFKGISHKLMNKFYYIVENWDRLSVVERILILDERINYDFLIVISDYNILNAGLQIDTIDKTLRLINLSYNKEEINRNRKIQCKKAINWCKDYKIPVNNNCYILKKFKNLKWR
tara:strand:+ start:2047 stop:3297 length:1251 start_codon:yes stop_codon:yes gene_type:complete